MAFPTDEDEAGYRLNSSISPSELDLWDQKVSYTGYNKVQGDRVSFSSFTPQSRGETVAQELGCCGLRA